jgi:hypothetical protein
VDDACAAARLFDAIGGLARYISALAEVLPPVVGLLRSFVFVALALAWMSLSRGVFAVSSFVICPPGAMHNTKVFLTGW